MKKKSEDIKIPVIYSNSAVLTAMAIDTLDRLLQALKDNNLDSDDCVQYRMVQCALACMVTSKGE